MMDTIKSFKGYGKVDQLEEGAFRKKTRRRLAVLVISTVVLVAVVVGAVAGTVGNRRNSKSDNVPSTPTSPAQSLKAVCSQTLYPESCYSSISALDKSNTTDPEEIFKLSLQVVSSSLSDLLLLPGTLINRTQDAGVKAALAVCDAVFNDAIWILNDSISAMENNVGDKLLSVDKINDLQTWLSAAVTDQEACLDALEEVNSTLLEDARSSMKNSTEYTSNSLAIVTKILGILSDFNIPIHRKLMSRSGSDFPDWVRGGDRKLLQAANPEPNVTVAKDGSGDVTTIKAAVAKIPQNSAMRFVVYVKAGIYAENIELKSSITNVMFYGDGMTQTIISGSENFVDGTPTYATATFAVDGKGFIAKDIGFRNTAGAAKLQAVAFRSASDLSVYYRCSFDAFQDTLYTYSNRQFYRECDISGTIDFIFGNAAAVFQSCNIYAKQPLSYQFNTITAQGKSDPNQNTGISVQGCTVSPAGTVTANTYLGRPWKGYSTTVFMETTIGSFVSPAGWTEWTPNAVPPSTIFYGEYQNTGPGSAVANRVKWAGVKPILSADQASKFTVRTFIQGAKWLPATNVVFQSTL